jgi:hypothetical protein
MKLKAKYQEQANISKRQKQEIIGLEEKLQQMEITMEENHQGEIAVKVVKEKATEVK